MNIVTAVWDMKTEKAGAQSVNTTYALKKDKTPLYDIGSLSWTVFFNVIYIANYRLFSLFLSGEGSQSKCIVVFVLLKYSLKPALWQVTNNYHYSLKVISESIHSPIWLQKENPRVTYPWSLILKKCNFSLQITQSVTKTWCCLHLIKSYDRFRFKL